MLITSTGKKGKLKFKPYLSQIPKISHFKTFAHTLQETETQPRDP